MLLAVTIGTITCGGITRFVGYYTPFAILSSVVMSIGAGLVTTLKTDSYRGYWIWYQVILGLGIGFGMQQPSLAAQTVLVQKDVPTGTSIMFFGQTLGGAVSIAIAENVFKNKLVEGVSGVASMNPRTIVNVGATAIRELNPPQFLPQVLSAYNYALTKAFTVSLAIACASILGSASLEWRSIREGQQREKTKVRAEKDGAERWTLKQGMEYGRKV